MNASRSSRAVTKELFFCAEPAVVGFADVTGGFVGFSVVTPVAGGVRHGFQHRFAPDIVGASLVLGPTSQRLGCLGTRTKCLRVDTESIREKRIRNELVM